MHLSIQSLVQGNLLVAFVVILVILWTAYVLVTRQRESAIASEFSTFCFSGPLVLLCLLSHCILYYTSLLSSLYLTFPVSLGLLFFLSPSVLSSSCLLHLL